MVVYGFISSTLISLLYISFLFLFFEFKADKIFSLIKKKYRNGSMGREILLFFLD
ncbi:hypothetical protein BDV25DRAFT_97706 [Aspergillus avenaceus]|uniref:Uncharacterized protein n=1 Tax=Aspergillus avenaceus TaxID=36643 RepID=A0A5N6TXZ4_ASPAV|nr:hypothetical protein BDV25DRAFT_97706 [Aspergillus avenaceus]